MNYIDPESTSASVADSVELTSAPCERCKGAGEVEGYGGNYIYCGVCAGTGKKPRFFTSENVPD